MKKHLIALAVLAASGAAMAQSSVQIYGIVDAFVGQTKDTVNSDAYKAGEKGLAPKAAERQTVVGSSGLKSSRWGIKGSEDLGGGLKAGFVLESGFNVDDGSAKTVKNADKSTYTGFDRAANVSLSGDFGAVALGRMATPYDSLRAAVNPIGDTNMSPVNNGAGVYKTAGLDYTDKVSNAIAYVSPVFNGFSGSAAVSLGENKTTTVDATQHTSLQVRYANGPLLVGYGYQKEESNNAAYNADYSLKTAATGIDSTTFNLLAASYDFGVAKLVGNYQIGKSEKFGSGKVADEKGYTFGVQAPVTSNINVFFGYAGAKYDAVSTGTDYKSKGYTLAANYVLSKRTDAYIGYKMYDKKDETHSIDLGKSTTLAVGVRHAF